MLASERVSMIITDDLKTNKYLPYLKSQLEHNNIPFYIIRLFNSQEYLRIIYSSANTKIIKKIINKQRLTISQDVKPFIVDYSRYGNEELYMRTEDYYLFLMKWCCSDKQNVDYFEKYIILLKQTLSTFYSEYYEKNMILKDIITIWSNYYEIDDSKLKLLESKIITNNCAETFWANEEELKQYTSYLIKIKQMLVEHKEKIEGEFPTFTPEFRIKLLMSSVARQNEIKLLITICHMTANMFGIHNYLELFSYLEVYRELRMND